MKTVKSLSWGVDLRIAELPKDNPRKLGSGNYTVPLIEHDYPAKTPAMWNAVYRKLGMEVRNVMLVGDPVQSREILQLFRKDPKYLGGGAGVGFKDEAVKYLDELDPLAEAIGAVNFILKTPGGKLKGFNTDGLGYVQGLEKAFEKKGRALIGRKAVVLGAGGAGNAVAFELIRKGMKVIILNRTVEKARVLAEKINDYFGLSKEVRVRFGGEDLVEIEVRDADAVVNVSTKGSAGELKRYSALAPSKLPATKENVRENLERAEAVLKFIPREAVISDIVLGKKLTPFLESAKNAGFEILDGVPMVVNQGVEAFWLLHGKEAQEKGVAKEEIRKIMTGAAG